MMSIRRFAAVGDAHRSAPEWRAKLKAARDEQEVLSVVRAFLSSLTHFEWALLGMQPGAANVESATDLAALSYDLVRSPYGHEQHAELIVSTMTAILSDAVARIAHLGNPRNTQTA